MNRNLLATMWMAVALGGCNMWVSTDEPPRASRDVTEIAPSALGGARAWIDRPLDGSQFSLGQAIPIRWHAADLEGVQQVEIRINGETFLISEDLDHTAQLANQELEWNPTEPGDYLIEVIPIGIDGARGSPADKRITVLTQGGIVEGAVYSDLNEDEDADDEGEGPLEGVTVILVECTEKLSLVTAADGAFRFEGLPFDGDCRMDFDKRGWRTTGTFPPGIDLPIHVSPRLDPAVFSVFLSPIATPTPTPSATPTPTRTPTPTFTPLPDFQEPPAPAIISPQGGVLLECVGDIVLRWTDVSDASGIDIYQVRLRVSYDNGATWSPAGTWESDDEDVNVRDGTDCGNLYSWRVRARDNAGNWGPYSSWATFGIALP